MFLHIFCLGHFQRLGAILGPLGVVLGSLWGLMMGLPGPQDDPETRLETDIQPECDLQEILVRISGPGED